MKTTILITLFIVALLSSNNSKAEIIDDLSDRQFITDYQEPGITRKTSSKQLNFNSDIGMLTRTLILVTPAYKYRQSALLIQNGTLTIDAQDCTKTAIVYDFNNVNLQDYNGILINVPAGSTGHIRIITDGPAGRSLSPVFNLADGNIYAQLQDFTGSRLFNNLTRIRINLTNNTRLSGHLTLDMR